MTFLKGTGIRADGLRRRRQFQPKYRLQSVDRFRSGAGAVAVRLVHQQHKIGQLGEIIVVALADGLLQPLHARLAARAFLLVDLVDVEDVDVNVRAEQVGRPAASSRTPSAALVVVAGDDERRVLSEFGDALENVLRAVRRKVGDELFIDGLVRCQHEEMAAFAREIQVG